VSRGHRCDRAASGRARRPAPLHNV
jgi:hypothetical protein